MKCGQVVIWKEETQWTSFVAENVWTPLQRSIVVSWRNSRPQIGNGILKIGNGHKKIKVDIISEFDYKSF